MLMDIVIIVGGVDKCINKLDILKTPKIWAFDMKEQHICRNLFLFVANENLKNCG
jgi:hypothetical protein